MTLVYRQCPADDVPHEPHQNDDRTRCLGAPERDERARTYDPQGAS